MKKVDIKKKAILDTGLKLWPNVSCCNIANDMGISHQGIAYHFGDRLRDSIAEHAVKERNSRVIAQLIAIQHPAIEKMSNAERSRHMKAVM